MARTLSKRTFRRVAAIALSASLLFATPAFAAPATSTVDPARQPAEGPSVITIPQDTSTLTFREKLAAKQAELDAFNAQLDELDRELSIAADEYNRASDQLQQVRGKVEVAQGDLDKAKVAYQFQTDVLASRASSMYKDGSLAAIDVLLDSKSLGDFVARVKFLNAIGVRDADIAASLKAQKDLMEQQVASLSDAQKQAESLEFELKARQIEVMLRIQERQQMLTGAQKDLLELLDKEAARRNTEERQLLADVLSGANQAGISVTPGTPVETALAYHGVPYLWGGSTPSGFDCSGLVLYVFAQHGVQLPHYSGAQFAMGEKIAPSALQPGDVVFFGSPIHHVGIYIGGGYFIHAPRTGDFVKISPLSKRSDYAGARRYPWQLRVGPPTSAVVDPNTVVR
jgi:cell wall-associated NlpC family hydrolase